MSVPVAAPPVRVLLVEDNPADADLIREALEEAEARASGVPGFELIHVDRLASGEARLAAGDIELVLLDLSLPDSHGFETFRRLGSRFPSVPIVVLSGLADEELAMRAVREGAQDYLVKGSGDGTAITRTLRYAMERKQAEEERAARAEVEAALRARDEFLATISHDLKAPLAAIKVRTQFLARRIARGRPPATDELLEHLTRIDETTTQATRLIDELLDLTRLEAGRPVELSRAPLDLGALAERAVTDWRQRSARHRFRLELPTDPVVGNWDERRLERVIANLLDNAVKYSPAGGEIVVAVDREGDAPVGWAKLIVRDEGVGIPEADLPRVFERFYRAGNVGQTVGTGIGLAGARQIVEQHGGTISVESRPGEGSTFTVRLPL
jgi:phosphoserine phosphatase RsbU/P